MTVLSNEFDAFGPKMVTWWNFAWKWWILGKMSVKLYWKCIVLYFIGTVVEVDLISHPNIPPPPSVNPPGGLEIQPIYKTGEVLDLGHWHLPPKFNPPPRITP